MNFARQSSSEIVNAFWPKLKCSWPKSAQNICSSEIANAQISQTPEERIRVVSLLHGEAEMASFNWVHDLSGTLLFNTSLLLS